MKKMQNIKTIKVGNLLWEADPPKKRMTWHEAMAYAASLGEGFRLPTAEELYLMFDRDTGIPVDNGLKWQPDYYWSATTYVDDTSGAWVVYFDGGYDYWYNKTYSYYCRCVKEAKES